MRLSMKYYNRIISLLESQIVFADLQLRILIISVQKTDNFDTGIFCYVQIFESTTYK